MLNSGLLPFFYVSGGWHADSADEPFMHADLVERTTDFSARTCGKPAMFASISLHVDWSVFLFADWLIWIRV